MSSYLTGARLTCLTKHITEALNALSDSLYVRLEPIHDIPSFIRINIELRMEDVCVEGGTSGW